MIESCEMYGCKCDGCVEQWDNGDCISYYADKELTEQGARDSEWYICDDGKTYCPECWSYDDDENLVFKVPAEQQPVSIGN